jgi:hypothetical protein
MNLRSRKRPIEGTETIFNNVENYKKRKDKVVSEPIMDSTKVEPVPSMSTTEARDIPLKKEDILRIVSSETPLDKAAILDSFYKRSNIRRQEVPTIYSSYFFRKDIINDFKRHVINLIPYDKISSFPLSTYNLYNKDDILNNTTYRPDILGSRILEKNSGYSSQSTSNMRAFINFLSKNICSDIGSNYAISAVRRAIDLTTNEKEFDILVASTKIIENVSLKMKNRLSGIVAFIIVELGECKKYPSGYSINLICTDIKPRIPPIVKGIGSVLMGAFLYTILSHPENINPSDPIRFPAGNGFLKVSSKQLSDGSMIENCFFNTEEELIPLEQVAVLELASAYTNTGGLCMYEKFGFTYDQTMFTDDTNGIKCFDDRNNLPMIIDFKSKQGYAELDSDGKKNKVASITAGIDRGFEKSKICSINGDKQRLLGHLKTLMLYIENTNGATINNYDGTSSLPELLVEFNKLSKPIGTRRSTSRQNNVTINDVINYIENQPATENPHIENIINQLTRLLPKKGGYSRKKNNRISKRFSKRRINN